MATKSPHTIRLPENLYDRLQQIGDGNASAGARSLANVISDQGDVGERRKTQITISDEDAEKLRRHGAGSLSKGLILLLREFEG